MAPQVIASRATALALLAATLAAASPARGDDVPARKQALLLLRVLAYDRNLKARAGDAVRLAVAYRPGDRESEERRTALVAAFEEVSREVVAGGLPVEVAAVPWRDAADFEARVAAARPAGVYVCGGLLGVAKEIARVTRRHGVLSAGASKDLVEAGLAVGMVNRGLRAGVVVNLHAAKAEGVDLDATLLGIAEVIP
jgi:hypothetical protein